jgi:nucleoside-diphosphate-sugar epimerase/predicted dehydrogenase
MACSTLRDLVDAGADVIHVLTPPSTHVELALEALEDGCHVLIEKPVAEDADEARRMGRVAAAKGLVATVDHSLLYDPQVLRALDRVKAGGIGQVTGVDVFRSQRYPPYEGGPLPPHMRDAAYPWRDVGVHCLYLMEELLGRVVDLDATWTSLGGDRNLAFDEWRGLVRCERGLGHFQLSWNANPLESQMVIHGTRGMLRVDLLAMFQTRRAATPLPKAAERVVNAYAESLRPLVEVPVSVSRFVRREVQPYQGVRNLIGEFYRRLAAGQPPPVAIDDAARVVEWVERVARAAEAEHARSLARLPRSPTTEFLVTGASGSLGSAVVRRLLERGVEVRAFVRHPPDEPSDGVQYVVGNLGDPEAVERAVTGAEVVIHAGAAMSGGWPEHLGATVVGTQNVVAACLRSGVRQLVHLSSLSVVDWGGAAGGAISEGTPLEPRAEERGAYTRAKLEAERVVLAAAGDGLPCVVLRPGLIFGGGIPLLGASIARRAAGRWIVLGDGRLTVPLVYIDDVVDAVLAAVDRGLASGEVVQVVDEERLTQEEVLALAGVERGDVVEVPRPAVFLLGRLSEHALGAVGRRSPLAVHRLRAALAQTTFASQQAEELLGWRPRVGVREGIRRVA